MPMRRYEGYLAPRPTRECWPREWWIVAVQLEPHTDSATPTLRSRALSRWTAIRLHCAGPRCTSREEYHGSTAGQFWSAILYAKRQHSRVWVMSPRALMCWQTLELWERIELGQLRLDVSQIDKHAPISSRGMGRPCGTLMVSDPPTCGVFRHDETDTSLKWTCSGNYGLQPTTAGIDAETEASCLASRLCIAAKLLAVYGIGSWRISAGSIAFRGWSNCYTGPALYVSSGRRGDTLENRAIAGGHIHARLTEHGPVTAYAVDARSMYPHISCNDVQATDLIRRNVQGSEAEEMVRDNALACLAHCLVECYDGRYPQRTERGVCYPSGVFDTVLCGPELSTALCAGHLKKVFTAHQYRLDLPLKRYGERIWAARRDVDAGLHGDVGQMIKRMGTALIGKFLQRQENWEEQIPDISDPVWGTWQHIRQGKPPLRYRSRAGMVECCYGSELCSHCIPSIPLWIWSYGRVRLWQWMQVAGLANVHYADTDGLILSPEGYERLCDAGYIGTGEWGQLRKVAGPCSCIIRGPRDFQLGERIVKSGYPLADRDSDGQTNGPAWYRLPWSQMASDQWSGTWTERAR